MSITSTIKETDQSPVKNFIIQEKRIRKLELQRNIAIILFILSFVLRIWIDYQRKKKDLLMTG